MKKNILSILVGLVGLFLLFSGVAMAYPTVQVTELNETSNSATVGFSSYNSFNPASFYTDYEVKTDLFGTIDAFCVDPQLSGGTLPYELRPIADFITTYGVNGAEAAWVADQSWNESWSYNDEDTQIAIWHLLYGGDDLKEIEDGDDFYYVKGANDINILDIIALAEGQQLTSDGWYPTNNVSWLYNADNQDYLINQPVPEPVSILLFGFGLAGFAGFRKKFMKKFMNR